MVVMMFRLLVWKQIKRVLKRIYEGFRVIKSAITSSSFVIAVIAAIYLALLLIGRGITVAKWLGRGLPLNTQDECVDKR